MILIISRKKSAARNLTEALKTIGILSYPITASETFKEISPMYRAVVVIDPGFLADIKHFIDSIHSYVKNIPVYAVYTEPIGEEAKYFVNTISDRAYTGTLINDLADYLHDNSLPCVGDYRLAGINASADLGEVLYFDRHVDLTKTQSLILRFLLRSYPNPKKAETIIKYIYKPSKSPEPSSIRTHICKINESFKAIFGDPIIASPNGLGYVIYTPELKKRYQKNEQA